MQKKAYRVLEEMCGGDREACRSFVLSNLEQLKQVLLGSLKTAASPAKRVRPGAGLGRLFPCSLTCRTTS